MNSRKRAYRWIIGGIAFVLSSVTVPAAADGPNAAGEARRLFEAAMTARTADQMAEAAALLQRSFELVPAAATAFNLADVRSRLGQMCASAELYDRLLEREFGALQNAQQQEVTRRRTTVMARTAAVRLRVEGPEHATLAIDAAARVSVRSGRAVTLCLDSGEHRFLLMAENYRSHDERLTLVAGQDEELRIEMLSNRTGPVRQNPAEQDSPSAVPWILAGVGLLAGAAIVGIYFATRGPDTLSDPVWGNKEALRF